MTISKRSTILALAAAATILAGQAASVQAMGDASGHRYDRLWGRSAAMAESMTTTESATGQTAVREDGSFSDARADSPHDLDDRAAWAARALDRKEHRGR